ncbi:unnamed protein product [Allacma fusca]|uniref:DUF4789 domain-containing protein n=1 Tax=Allacma fusca TaxID=39272 RepID=A0A8J2KUK7_9HEXA|nr:unnamed protein product [Allacma fusca]
MNQSVIISSFFIFLCLHQTPAQNLSKSEPAKDPKRLCPQGHLYFNGTRTCYIAGEKGPCQGSLMAVESPNNDEFGDCTCKIFSHLGLHCQTRPAVHWSDSRCYFIFDQGPCRTDEWLAVSPWAPPKCEQIPCLDLYHAQTPLNYSRYEEASAVFVFGFKNSCYITGTQAFCPKGHLAVFAAGSDIPSCRKRKDICYNLPFYTHPEAGTYECEDGTESDGHGGCLPSMSDSY